MRRRGEPGYGKNAFSPSLLAAQLLSGSALSFGEAAGIAACATPYEVPMSLEQAPPAATPFTAGLFLISAVSGVALFFHIGMGAFHEMHEWLSMLLLVPFGLHVWRNWGGMVRYFRNGALTIPLALTLLLASSFAVPAIMGTKDGNPAAQALALIAEMKLKDLAPLLHRSTEELTIGLRNAGWVIKSDDLTVREIAQDSERRPAPARPPRHESRQAVLTAGAEGGIHVFRFARQRRNRSRMLTRARTSL